jgi:hypothetical protein
MSRTLSSSGLSRPLSSRPSLRPSSHRSVSINPESPWTSGIAVAESSNCRFSCPDVKPPHEFPPAQRIRHSRSEAASFAMLLPSPLPCDTQTAHISKLVRPKLASSTPYRPVQQAQNAAASLIASCRALQAILGNAPVPARPHTPPPSRRPSQDSPQTTLCKEWRPTTPTGKSTNKLEALNHAPPRGLNKRRRNEFEDEEMPDTSEEKENFERIYVTPKRLRKAPLLMPLGLSAEDFEALDEPSTVPTASNAKVSLPPRAPPQPRASYDCDEDSSWSCDEFGNWTTDDDRLLVETVLEKLKLSKREWNECAQRLGKDKDSLGKRWKMLVVKGNVGLRRGGRLRRTDLDIESW